MKGTFILVALALGAVTASASTISATLTLNNDQPTLINYGPYEGDYSWSYTLTVDSGDLGDVESVDFTDLLGVVGVHLETGNDDWSDTHTTSTASFTDNCGQYYYQNCQDETGTSATLTIYSTDGSTGNADYDLALFTYDPSGTIGGPAQGTAPEPASLGLTGLALFALGAFKLRRS